ncbi:MAG: tetratricopeptide repeat protein [Bacteroidota bacterium]|nr:tetratricopeptide repeat protein [Bacteroidota bacterium]MDP4235382.1 tetratricopeptide repeat protein [Bacteroidota bacterium]
MKHCSLLLSFLVIILLTVNVRAQTPELVAQKASEDELAVIQRGAALHDNGKYDEALEQFSKVLVKNSACVQAMYEMANTYYAKGDRKKAFEMSETGLKYQSSYSALFYVMEGSIQDDEGNPQKAIESYRKATAVSPNFQSAYFNLGITLRRMGRNAEALENFKKSVMLKYSHPSSNYHMAKIYTLRNQKIPAFMAYMCFLLYANDDDTRISDAIEEVKKLVTGDKKTTTGDNIITLSVDTTEGDFVAAELLMGFSSFGIDSKLDSITGTKLSPFDAELRLFESVFKGIAACASPEKKDRTGFAMQFYGKYFQELSSSGNLSAFCHIIGRHINKSESDKWLDSHQSEVKAFSDWETEYHSKK